MKNKVIVCYTPTKQTNLHNASLWFFIGCPRTTSNAFKHCSFFSWGLEKFGFVFQHALWAVDQSQQTQPSDQSEQSRLSEPWGLERLRLWTNCF